MIKTKSIKLVIKLKADPHTIYETFMNSNLHSKLINSGASIERRVGGRFSVWDGFATGRNLELIADRKIMQSWRANDWEEGVFSKITLEFFKMGSGTKFTFTQTGIPPDRLKSITKGWEDFYWKPLKRMYG